jgi:Fe-S-cluster containining protein
MGFEKGFEKDFEKWKMEYFGHFCMTKCGKTCCDMRNVSLYVYEDELMRLYGGKIDFENLAELGIKTENVRGIYSIESKDFCRQFDSSSRKCLDYVHRPQSCREYPFLVEKDAVLIKNGCPLSKEDPEYKKLSEIASQYGKVIVQRG